MRHSIIRQPLRHRVARKYFSLDHIAFLLVGFSLMLVASTWP
jgi:hypothetical protein